MSGKRVLACYAGLLLGFAVVGCRLFELYINAHYAARAAGQSLWCAEHSTSGLSGLKQPDFFIAQCSPVWYS